MISVVTKKPKKAKNPSFARYKPLLAPSESTRKPPKKKRRVGRPQKYETVEELEKLINKYFKSCWHQKYDSKGIPQFIKDVNGKRTKKKLMVQFKPYTITGLAIALDTTRDVLIDYEAKDQFSNTIKRAKQMCHNYAEEYLYVGKNPAGAIFNLKNNYGWKEKAETEHSGSVVWREEPPK